MNKNQLIKVAQEINELGMDPEINIAGADGYLKVKIKEAITLLTEDDEFTPATTKLLVEMGWERKEVNAEDDVEPEDDIQDAEEIVDDEEPKEADDATDIPSLIREIKKTDTMKDLKDLAKAYDEFIDLRDKLTKFTTKEALRGVMLKTLENLSKPEPAPAPVVEEKKPAPAESKKPKAEKKEKNTYTRVDSVCDAVKNGKSKTVKELITNANSIYVDNGGSDNLAESKFTAKYVLKALSNFNIEVPTE